VLAEWRIDSGIESTIFLLFAILSIVITKKMLQRGNELKQLEESLSRLAAIVEFSDDAIISKDLDGFILSWNAGAVRLFGYSPNEAIGELISILIPFELQDEENRILQSLKAGEPVSHLETVRIARDGRRIDVSVTSSPLKDTIGRVIGASKIIRDITDHKRTEDALKESEFFFKESQRAASIGSYKTDLITGKCEISEVLSGIFGLVSDSILYLQEWLKMIHPDDRDMMDQYLREEVVAKRNIFSKEYRIIRQNDGETRWVLGLGELKFDDDDIPVTLIGTIQDITDRKEAERSILRAKREWERTFDSIPDMIAIIDKDHLITRANKALAQHMGLSVEECIGQPCYSNVHCSDHPPAFCPHVFTMADGGQHEVEIYEKRLGGDFLVTTSPLFDEQERMIGSVHIARDITERKQIENILRFLGQCGSTESGEDFFHELARYLASALMMDFVCIDRLEEDRLSAETLAVFHNGQFEDNVTYTLKDTPCGDVVGKNVCSFPKNVCGLFPNDQVLQDLQAESYLGTTLWSAQGKPIGLIAVIGRHPLEDTRLGESVLQLVAVRAAGELERLQTEEQIKNQMKELQRFNKELIRFNKIAVGRELRMIELKKVINEMCANAGLPKRYDLDINGDQP
jgi:PAS domain S-box-containing protein